MCPNLTLLVLYLRYIRPIFLSSFNFSDFICGGETRTSSCSSDIERLFPRQYASLVARANPLIAFRILQAWRKFEAYEWMLRKKMSWNFALLYSGISLSRLSLWDSTKQTLEDYTVLVCTLLEHRTLRSCLITKTSTCDYNPTNQTVADDGVKRRRHKHFNFWFWTA